MEASNISFEQAQLQNELEEINIHLEWLYQRGCNDENLVSRKREIERLLKIPTFSISYGTAMMALKNNIPEELEKIKNNYLS